MAVLDQSEKSSFWQRLGPKRQQHAVIGGAIFIFLALGYFFLSGSQPPPQKKKVGDDTNLITNADTRALGLTGLNKRVDEMESQLSAVQRQAKDLANKGPAGATTPKGQAASPTSSTADQHRLAEQQQEIQQLRQQVEAQRNQTASPPGTLPQTARPGTTAVGQAGSPNGKPAEVYPRIRTIDSDAGAAAAGAGAVKEKTAAAAKPAKEPTAYIPSGSMLSGVLLTGVDAPTGRGSNADPIPILVRLKHEAVLPNRYREDMRECFIVGAAYGDLSSERAYARGETLSCVRNDGKVIDTKITMYLVGEDGKAGMRGHLVSKQGQAIAKAAVAGFAQAYANALQPNYNVYSNGSGGAAGNTPLSTQTLTAGTYGGASSALDRIAKFEIDLANQMFPVVEIDAGRPVTFIVLKGANLPLVAANTPNLP